MMVPRTVEGLSIQLCSIQSNDFCCPAVVGMRNGTGDFAHPITLHTNPTTKIATAAYGMTMANRLLR